MNHAVQAMLSKGVFGAEASCDTEEMDVKDDDDAEGFVRTSIMEEDEDDANESVNDSTSAKRDLGEGHCQNQVCCSACKRSGAH